MTWTHFRVNRRSPRYWHVTFDHPPINTITATTVAKLGDLVSLIEQDPDLNVVVFDSVTSRENTLLGQWEVGVGVVPGGGPMARALGAAPTGLSAWVDVLVRPPWNDFVELFRRPAQQPQAARLQQLGLNTDSDFERSLGRRLVESLPDA